jgi:hypothetical protein
MPSISGPESLLMSVFVARSCFRVFSAAVPQMLPRHEMVAGGCNGLNNNGRLSTQFRTHDNDRDTVNILSHCAGYPNFTAWV